MYMCLRMREWILKHLGTMLCGNSSIQLPCTWGVRMTACFAEGSQPEHCPPRLPPVPSPPRPLCHCHPPVRRALLFGQRAAQRVVAAGFTQKRG